jgi:molybdopterin converting factor small subunit
VTILRLPSLMKSYVNNQTEVHLHGETIDELLADLIIHYPQIKIHIMDKNGDLRRYINLFINKINIKELDAGKTKVREDDIILLLPSISGGCL